MTEDFQRDAASGRPAEETSVSELAQKRVLIVEDDVALARFLMRELALKGAHAVILHDGETALLNLESARYDLIIMDLNLPRMDGLELLTRVRATQPQLPVLVLTARNRTEDRVMALAHGADDCLIKPFSFQELLARIASVLRRHVAAPASEAARPYALIVHREEHSVMRGPRRIELTPREFAILEILLENIGKPVSRATLMRDVWNVPFDPTTNIVDVYMKYLRDKIDHEGEPKLIRTIRGVGYLLSEE